MHLQVGGAGGSEDIHEEYTSIVVTLNRAIKPEFVPILQDRTKEMSKWVFDVYSLASTVVWKAIEEGTISELELTKGSCKQLALAAIQHPCPAAPAALVEHRVKAHTRAEKLLCKWPSMVSAFDSWYQCRTETAGYTAWPDMTMLTQASGYLATEMMTAISNIIVMRTYKIVRWACLMWVKSKINLTAAEAKTLLSNAKLKVPTKESAVVAKAHKHTSTWLAHTVRPTP